jgi:sporulation protein YlmC with PRC-barrel domain
MRRFVSLLAVALLASGGAMAAEADGSTPLQPQARYATPGYGSPAAIERQQHRRLELEGLANLTQRFVESAKVTMVQQRLHDLGYDVTVDGRLGPATRAAVRAFQADRGMVVNGWITADLIAEMNTDPKTRARKAEVAPATTEASGAPEASETCTAAASSAPPPPPPPVPEVKVWTPKTLTGKTVHAIAGDRIGKVEDVAVAANGVVAGVVVAMESLYGDDSGQTLIPWVLVGAAVERKALVLGLGVNKVNPLRANPPPFKLAADQWVASTLIGADVRMDSKYYGTVDDALFNLDGKLVRLEVRRDFNDEIETVAAARVTMLPARRRVDVAMDMPTAPEPPHDLVLPSYTAD